MKQFKVFLIAAVIYALGLVHGLLLRPPVVGSTPGAMQTVSDKGEPLTFSVCPFCHRPIPQETNRVWSRGERDIVWERR